jgi:PAS domain S-box-containing protein
MPHDSDSLTAGASDESTREGESAARPAQAALEKVLGLVAERPGDLGAILGASSEALIAFDEHRTILGANRGGEAFFGYEAGALDGVSTDELIPERLRQPQAPPMTHLADLMHIDLPGRRRDGRELVVEWTFGSVITPSGPVFVMTLRDRAAVEQAIEALRASEERFRLLVEGVRDYTIFMLDPAGRVSNWNGGAERSEGWSASEIIGQSYEVFFTPEDRADGTPQRLLASAMEKGSEEVSGWRMRKDGTRFYVSAYLTALRSPGGELRGFAKITRDLTERLRAEEAEKRLVAEQAGRAAAEEAERRVRASEERLRRLQRVTAALSEAATPGQVAAVVLDQSLQALGASGGAVYVLTADGRTLEMIDQRGHPDSAQPSFATVPLDRHSPIADAARERTPGFYESFEACAERYPELRHLIQLGDFQASASLPLLTHGALLGVLGVRFRERRVLDASERAVLLTLSELGAQALERARLFAAESAARADAESANRSKDEFLAMLGHELRNPLAPIVTALQLMKLRSNESLQKERTVIERQVTHLLRLVDDLLDVSRITRGKVELKKQRISLGEVVTNAVELASPLLEQRQQHLTVAVPGENFEVEGDATRLAQVVSNLLTNAAKYTPPGGHIAVEGSRQGGRVVLQVRDDGCGISPSMLPRVFDLFAQERQSIDRSQGGLGLGLAIVKSLVGMHGGSVSAASKGHGQGSVFTVELPHAAPLPEAAPASSAGPASASSGSGRRVLVVDDNLDAAELLTEVLHASGHATAIAHDGPAALELASSFHPEIALLDIGLPVMDGYELARRLRGQFPQIRLIAITGYGQSSDRQRTREAGFDEHLVKPVRVEVLRAALR